MITHISGHSKLKSGVELNQNSFDGLSLMKAIHTMSDIDQILFLPMDSKYKKISFKYKPNRNIIFAIYTKRNIEEWFALYPGFARPPDKFYWQILGWQTSDHRCVVGVDLISGDILLQGE